jgi:hypothetical protein
VGDEHAVTTTTSQHLMARTLPRMVVSDESSAHTVLYVIGASARNRRRWR